MDHRGDIQGDDAGPVGDLPDMATNIPLHDMSYEDVADEAVEVLDHTRAFVLQRVETWRDRYHHWRETASEWLAGFDLTPDLAQDIGSKSWFRGLGTMLGSCAVACIAGIPIVG